MSTTAGTGARRVARAAAYALFLLALLEGTSRILLSSERVRRHLGRDLPALERIDWVQRHAATRTLAYAFDVYDSLRGWAVAPGIANKTVFGDKILNSTPRGVRGTADVPYDRPPGRGRILVFGDSYTFGDEVSDTETYAADLGRLLPRVDVLNLGVHGYGHDQMLEYLRSEGVKYRPDVVLLGYVWFDQYRNLFDFTGYAKPVFELRDGRAVLTGVPVPRPEQVLARDRWHPRLWDLTTTLAETARWRLGLNQARAAALTQAIFDEWIATVRQIRAEPLFVYLPVIEELDDTSSALTAREQFLKGYCDSRRVACLFLRPAFAAAYARGARFNRPGRHWDPAAHQVAARAIAKYLASERVGFPLRLR